MANYEKVDQASTTDEPTKYRGIKAMPFLIGRIKRKKRVRGALDKIILHFNHYQICLSGMDSINLVFMFVGNETFDKAGTVATSANLLVYLTTVFNMKRITAVYFVQVYSGSTNFATLIGAFLSDTYFGRYNILAFATISSFLVLVISMYFSQFCCMHADDQFNFSVQGVAGSNTDGGGREAPSSSMRGTDNWLVHWSNTRATDLSSVWICTIDNRSWWDPAV